MHDPPRQQEQDEQHGEGIEEADLAEHIESKQAEDRRHLDALQPVGAAGDIGKALGQRLQQQGDPERHHQRVRSTPLITRKLVRKPIAMAARPATTSATTGSVTMPCNASSPAQ